MSLRKMVGFWVVVLIVLTVFFMTPFRDSVPGYVLIAAVMAVAIAVVVVSQRNRTDR